MSRNGGSDSCFEASSGSSLELSDLQPSGCWSQTQTERWSDDKMEESYIQDVEPVRQQWCGQRVQRMSDGGSGRRRSWSPTDREWVVRRRSDGSRYIRRRRLSADRRRSAGNTRTDPARRSQLRPVCHQVPAIDNHRHGCTADSSSCMDVRRTTEDVFHTLLTLDERIAVDHEDYGTVEWIYSPQWTDSSCHIVAVI